MQRHPYFDLLLHDDNELSAFLGSAILQRTTLHEWPLSCVQRLLCATGASYIYKVQRPPTVEPAFYQQVCSPIVVAARLLPVDPALADTAPAALILEDIQAPHLYDVAVAEPIRLSMVDEVLALIAQLDGNLPAMSDIRTLSQWVDYGRIITDDLRALVDSSTFQHVNTTMIDHVTAQMHASSVLAAITGPTGYVHLDLWAENVLVLAGGYRVLDWQRPIWGPVALDRATLLEAIGLDPAGYVSAGVLQLRKLLLIGWFAQAARRWFVAGAPTYDAEIAQLIRKLDA